MTSNEALNKFLGKTVEIVRVNNEFAQRHVGKVGVVTGVACTYPLMLYVDYGSPEGQPSIQPFNLRLIGEGA